MSDANSTDTRPAENEFAAQPERIDHITLGVEEIHPNSRSLRGWLQRQSVFLLGTIYFAFGITHVLVDPDPTMVDGLEAAPTLVLSLVLVGTGAWLWYRNTEAEHIVTAAVFSLLVSVVSLLLGAVALAVWSLEHGPIPEPLLLLTYPLVIGGLQGVVFGLYYSQQRHRTETLRQRIAELSTRNERLEDVAGIISHDLRNPLTIAAGNLERARESGDPTQFDRIERAHDRMERLIEEVLTLVQQGDRKIDCTTVDLDAIAFQSWETVATPAADLIIETDQTIEADVRRLQSLFENLYRNAIEHGGTSVTVAVGPLDDGQGFYIEDDGRGIPTENRERIFEGGYSTKSDGTGFGLAIVRQAAELHGWQIIATEGSSGGARFEIRDVTIVD